MKKQELLILSKLIGQVQELEKQALAKSNNTAEMDEYFNTDVVKKDLSKYQITQANSLIRAIQKLQLVPQRIIRLAMSKIDPNLTDISQCRNIKVSAHEYAQVFNCHEKTAYRELQSGSKAATESSIALVLDEKKKKTAFFPMVEIAILDDGVLSIDFSRYLVPLLLNLKSGNFTTYKLTEISEIKSLYTLRFYELIEAQLGKKKKVNFFRRTEDLRAILNVPDTYDYGKFKTRVLLKALNDLEKNKGYEYTLTEEKRGKGKKITHIDIEIIKPKTLEEIQSEELIQHQKEQEIRRDAVKNFRKKESDQIEDLQEKMNVLLSMLSDDEVGEFELKTQDPDFPPPKKK